MPDDKIKVLITAFGPFQGVDENITEKTLENFKKSDFYKRLPKNVEIVTEILNTDYKNLQAYGDLIKTHNPTYVIAMGHQESGPGARIDYEAMAFNSHYLPAKGQGSAPTKQVESGAPETQFGVNSKIVFDLLKKDNPLMNYSYVSDLAICNSVYYELIHEMEQAGKPNRTIFLHLNAPSTTHPLTYEKIDPAVHQPLFNEYVRQYSSSLEQIVTKLNHFYSSTDSLKSITMTDAQFERTYIPPQEKAAQYEFDNRKKELPKK